MAPQHMSDVSATHLVSFSGGGRSILSTGEDTSIGRPDARTALFGPGSSENIKLNMQIQKLSGTA